MDFDWKNLIGSVAPTLATALGGPLAGMATKAISRAVLGNDGGDKADILAAIATGDTDVLVKLKEAENSFLTKMKELDIDLEKIASDDRNSARQREIATKDNAPKVLAGVIVTGFFAILAAISFVELPAASQAPVNILLGALTAMLTQVGNYYFGSSAGSSRKNEMMAGILKK